jgi:hypothetical protein
LRYRHSVAPVYDFVDYLGRSLYNGLVTMLPVIPAQCGK